jgi:hypothetical protein
MTQIIKGMFFLNSLDLQVIPDISSEVAIAFLC